MFTTEQIETLMKEAGLDGADYFIGCKTAAIVTKAAEMKIIDKDAALLEWADAFVVTVTINGIQVISDRLNSRMLMWNGYTGADAVRGVLTVVHREAAALRDRVAARFHASPF